MYKLERCSGKGAVCSAEGTWVKSSKRKNFLFLPPLGFEPLTFRVRGCMPLTYFYMQLPRILISMDVNECPETFPANCARARFAGCIFMRHIMAYYSCS